MNPFNIMSAIKTVAAVVIFATGLAAGQQQDYLPGGAEDAASFPIPRDGLNSSSDSPLSPECRGSFVLGAVCPLDLDNVLDIDGYSMADEAQCQYSCFRDRECSHFTYFRMAPIPGTKEAEGRKKCVLFRSCPSLAPCRSCFTGPAVPALMECMNNAREKVEGGDDDAEVEEPEDDVEQQEEEEEEEEEYEDFGDGITEQDQAPTTTTAGDESTTTTTTTSTTTTTATDAETGQRQPTNAQQPRPRIPKQLEQNDVDDDDSEFDVVGVDEGLLEGREDPVEIPEEQRQSEQDDDEDEEVTEEDDLDDDDDLEEAFPDEYFDEDAETLPPTSSSNPQSPPRRPPPPFFHCVMGGYGPRGPIGAIGHLLPTTPRPSRRPRELLPSLPAEFPLGNEGVFATMLGASLFACSPGATELVTTDRRLVNPLIGLDPFGNPSTTTVATTTSSRLRTGRCFVYSSPVLGWMPFGSAMNTFRGGGTITRMGRFLVAMGGRRFPNSLNSIEVLNTRNPRRWRTMTRLSLPSPTFDQCVVAVNRTALFMTGGFGQESQATVLDLKGKRWAAAEPMKQPRRKHSCLKARVNGRDGVIVAGGASDAVPALASMEFYDLTQNRWLSLGRMREGRRFPGLTVVAGNLIVSGGESTDALGRTVILDGMETLRGKRWRSVRQRMAQPRSRFASIRIPRTFF